MSHLTENSKAGSRQEHTHAQKRELPAHVQAQLASAGRATDTAGQPWAGRNLGEGTSHTHQYPTDTGLTEESVQRAFDSFSAGDLAEEVLVDALRSTRVFAPVLAEVTHAEITDEGLVSDKESDMALISIQAPDGRRALPVFTSVDALTSWHASARPVAADMRKTCLAAVEDDNQLIVINPGSELTFVLRRPAVWAIAKAEEWVPSYKDAAVAAELARLVEDLPEIVDLRAEAGQGIASVTASGQQLSGGGPGPELKITLLLIAGLTQEQLNRTVAHFQQRLAASSVISEKVDSVQLALAAA